MAQPPDAFDKKEPAEKSRDDLIRLLLRLNAKLREKLSLGRKRISAPLQTEVMIILLNRRQENPPPREKSRQALPSASGGAWIDDLFAEIQGRAPRGRRKS